MNQHEVDIQFTPIRFGRLVIDVVSIHHQWQQVTEERIGRWDTHRMPYWTMVWSGSQGYNAKVFGKTVTRLPRSWSLHAPNIPFSECISSAEAQREFSWLFFKLHGALTPISEQSLWVVADPDDCITEAVRKMYHAQQRGSPADALIIHGLFLSVLGEIVNCAHTNIIDGDQQPWRVRAPNLRTDEPGLLSALDNCVAHSLKNPPSRKQLAEALHISESSLAHRFRAETGMTIVERIRWLRIREAKTRFADPEASVKSVAASLGFSSTFYFSRVFKAVAGMTPDDYIRQCLHVKNSAHHRTAEK